MYCIYCLNQCSKQSSKAECEGIENEGVHGITGKTISASIRGQSIFTSPKWQLSVYTDCHGYNQEPYSRRPVKSSYPEVILTLSAG